MFALHWHFGDVPSAERECTKYVLQPACGPLLFVLLLGRQPAAEKSEMLRTVNSVHCSHCVCLSCCIFRSLKFLIFSQFFHSRWASILPSLFRSVFQTITIWQMQRSSASRVSESNRKGKIDAELKLAVTLWISIPKCTLGIKPLHLFLPQKLKNIGSPGSRKN